MPTSMIVLLKVSGLRPAQIATCCSSARTLKSSGASTLQRAPDVESVNWAFNWLSEYRW